MVTAILPQITPSSIPDSSSTIDKPVNGKIAGLAGLCTGLGALIAVVVFLPLPRVFISHGWELKAAVQTSFYVVGAVAWIFSVLMYWGLKRDSTKGFRSLFRKGWGDEAKGYFQLMGEGMLAAKDPRITLAYIGGLVARADSIVISLFIPTVVSHYFVERGLCDVDPHAPSSEIKEVFNVRCEVDFAGMPTSVFSGGGINGDVTITCPHLCAGGGMGLRPIR